MYGIQSTAARYTWAGYYLLVLISSLIGNTTILIAAIKYQAFKLHRLLVVIILHVAVCDLLFCTVSPVLPMMISMIADGWVLGRWFSYVQGYSSFYIKAVGMSLICTMTSSKLLVLRFPLKARSVETKQAHIGCAVIWTLVLSLPVTLILFYGDNIFFSYQHYSYSVDTSSWKYLMPVLIVIFMLIPLTIVIITTSLLIRYLIKSRRTSRRCQAAPRWQGIATVSLTALIYCISILPYAIYRITESYFEKQSAFYTTYYRIALSCSFLDIVSNFFIYCATVRSFRQWLRLKINWFYQLVTNVISNNGNLYCFIVFVQLNVNILLWFIN